MSASGMKQPSEIDLIRQIRKLAGTGKQKSIIQSIGDDCAVIRPSAGQDMVFTTDFVLEDRHFTRATHTPAEIGHKALARSLSDLAAMGAKPLFCLVSLAVPPTLATAFVPAFYKGLLALGRKYDISLAGGDLASFPSVVADVMCCGLVPRGKALLRSAARPGDFIYVTGSLGHSAFGFRTRSGLAWKRHRKPVPQLDVSAELLALGVRCAMDLSDGLSLDLSRLCQESGVSAELTSPIPLAKGVTLEDALHGGEDYELLFTAPQRKKIPASIAGIRITNIGSIGVPQEQQITLDGSPIRQKGFDHFA